MANKEERERQADQSREHAELILAGRLFIDSHDRDAAGERQVGRLPRARMTSHQGDRTAADRYPDRAAVLMRPRRLRELCCAQVATGERGRLSGVHRHEGESIDAAQLRGAPAKHRKRDRHILRAKRFRGELIKSA